MEKNGFRRLPGLREMYVPDGFQGLDGWRWKSHIEVWIAFKNSQFTLFSYFYSINSWLRWSFSSAFLLFQVKEAPLLQWQVFFSMYLHNAWHLGFLAEIWDFLDNIKLFEKILAILLAKKSKNFLGILGKMCKFFLFFGTMNKKLVAQAL